MISQEPDFDADLREYFDSDSSENGEEIHVHEMDGEEEEEDGQRSHYIEMSRSKLRQPSLSHDPKYQGKTVSKNALFESINDDHQSENTYGDNLVEYEELPREYHEIDEMEEFDTDDNRKNLKQSSLTQEIEKLGQKETQFFKKIKNDSTSNAEKGKHTRNQIAYSEAFLDLRVNIQNSLALCNRLPHSKILPYFFKSNMARGISDKLQHKRKDLRKNLVEVIEDLLKCVDSVCENNQLEKPSSSRATKRKMADTEQRNDDEIHKKFKKCWLDYSSWEKGTFQGYRNQTLEKWQRKINLLSSSSLLDKKLKALNQPIPQIIDSMLATDRDRLLKKTRLERSDYKVIGRDLIADYSANIEIFDDIEFFTQLMNDLISSRNIDDENNLQSSLHSIKMKEMQRKTRKQRETALRRASKGRRLRFEVHEKLQNLMTPVETGTWHEEMIEELFKSISRLYPSN